MNTHAPWIGIFFGLYPAISLFCYQTVSIVTVFLARGPKQIYTIFFSLSWPISLPLLVVYVYWKMLRNFLDGFKVGSEHGMRTT